MTKCKKKLCDEYKERKDQEDDESNYEKMIHGYLFHYNCYKHEWTAFPKGDRNKYFNGKSKSCISHKDIEECIDAVIAKEGKNV